MFRVKVALKVMGGIAIAVSLLSCDSSVQNTERRDPYLSTEYPDDKLYEAFLAFRDDGIQNGLIETLQSAGHQIGEELGNALIWKVFFSGASIIPNEAGPNGVSVFYYNPYCDGALFVAWETDGEVPQISRFSAFSAAAFVENRENRLTDLPRYLGEPEREPALVFPRHLTIDTAKFMEAADGRSAITDRDHQDILTGLQYLYRWTGEGFGKAVFLQSEPQNEVSRKLILDIQEAVTDQAAYEQLIGSEKGAKWSDFKDLPGAFLTGLRPVHGAMGKGGTWIVVYTNIDHPAYYVSLEFAAKPEGVSPLWVQIGEFGETYESLVSNQRPSAE